MSLLPAQAPKLSEYDVVTLRNVDEEDFVFEYDRSAGNFPHVIPAGEIRRFPRFLAEHALKHLIDKILNKRKERTSHEALRAELASQIVVDEEVIQKQPVISEAERQQKQIEELNKPSDLETLLKKHRAEEPQENIGTQPNMDQLPVKEEEKFEGLAPGEEPLKGDELDTTEKPVVETKEEVKPVPTRKEIYDYGEKTLNLVMDEKLKAKLEKMNVPDLLKEIGDPREALNA